MPEAKKKALLITGGAGFIGSALAESLNGHNCPVVLVDNLHPQIHPRSEPPDSIPEHVTLHVGDITQPDVWNNVLQNWIPDVVVHLAAETGTAQSLTEATRHASTNVVGTAAMIDAFSKAGITPRHIVLASSRAIYGEGAWLDKNGHVVYPPVRSHEILAAGRWDPVSPAESGQLRPLKHRAATIVPNPTSVYGSTKLAQEHILTAWCSATHVPLSIFRLQNVYGPGQSPFNSYTGIITLFHRQARRGVSLEVYEDGNIGRDFVYIDDVVDALRAGLDRPPSDMRVLDVGTGRTTMIIDAARAIAEMHGAPDPSICGKFRDGDVRWATADVEPLAEELGVRPRITFADGVRRVGGWLVEKGYA